MTKRRVTILGWHKKSLHSTVAVSEPTGMTIGDVVSVTSHVGAHRAKRPMILSLICTEITLITALRLVGASVPGREELTCDVRHDGGAAPQDERRVPAEEVLAKLGISAVPEGAGVGQMVNPLLGHPTQLRGKDNQ